MLEAVREFAAERLGRNLDLESATRTKHASYFLSFAKGCVERLGTDREAEGLSGLAKEDDNLQTALRWAERAGDAETCALLAAAIYRSTFLRGFWEDAATVLAIGLGAGDSVSPPIRANLHFLTAWLERERGDLSGSRQAAETALTLQRETGDREAMRKTLNLLCGLRIAAGELDEASALLDEMETLIQGRDLHWQGVIFHNRACIADLREDYDQARELNESALRCRRLGGLKRGVAESLCNLGGLAYKRGDFKQAIDSYQEALRIRLTLHDRLGAAILLWNLAEAAEQVGSQPAAIALYREAERQFRELQSVYTSAATDSLDRMQQTLPPEAWRQAAAEAETKSWEDWAWSN